MPDDRIYDCINLFKFSNTGRGLRVIAGSAEYQNGYNQVIKDVVTKLWSLWKKDTIRFEILKERLHGQASRGGLEEVIKITKEFEPKAFEKIDKRDPLGDLIAGDYGSPKNQERVAAASLTMVHEGAHLVRPSQVSVLEEEMLCRTLEVLYSQDLLNGIFYRSKASGKKSLAMLGSLEMHDRVREMADHLKWYQKGQLLDFILNKVGYRESLNVAFIRKSISWWDGPQKRWLSTRGMYLKTLASKPNSRNARVALTILESIGTPSDWSKVRKFAGDVKKVQRLIRSASPLDTEYARRIQAVQRRIRENIGVQAASL